VCTYASGVYRQQQPIVFVCSCDGHSEHAVPEATQICRHGVDGDTNRYEPLTTGLKFGERFSHVGPKAWNELPTELQDLTGHRAFRRRLKTFLFERAFTT